MNRNAIYKKSIFIFCFIALFYNALNLNHANAINDKNYIIRKLSHESIDYYKNLDLNNIKESNGLKLFIKPLTVSQSNTIYTKNDFLFNKSPFPNRDEEKKIQQQMQLFLKKTNSKYWSYLIGIKNVSSKPIFICTTSINENISWGTFGAKLGEKSEFLEPNYLTHRISSPITTEDVVMLKPGEIQSMRGNLLILLKSFKKGNKYSIYNKYSVYKSKKSPNIVFPSINGKITSLDPVPFTIWEGELQSNALTVVVR